MTLGFHSPLPPARSGVADYAAALLDALRRRARVKVNSSEPSERELYHLGNNQLHREIYRRALARPGVVVLHDAVLHHFFLGSSTAEEYVEEFVYNYGEWSRQLAHQLWKERARSAQDPRYFQYPMLRRIAERSRAVVVHNQAAAKMVRAHAPASRVAVIPHLFLPPRTPAGSAVERTRARLGARAADVVFGVFGYLRESKRLFSVLTAFRLVRRAVPEAQLWLAGQFASAELERALRPAMAAPGLHYTGHLEESDFWRYAAATDVCVNLRWPAAGETSGIAIRMMGLGKPTLVTAGEEVSGFPEDACVKIEPGTAEEEMLAAAMLWLAEDAAARREIGRRAAHHIAREHNRERCVELYWQLLTE